MSRRIHVCLLTSAHPVDDVRLKRKLVHTLIHEGFRVTWVGPNYEYVTEPNKITALANCSYRLFTPMRNRLERLLVRRLAQTASGVEGVDIYLAAEPDSARVAVALAKKCKARVILELHELYHQSHIHNWAPKFARPLASLIVRGLIAKVSSRCDLVVGVSEGVLTPYRQSARECIIVRNCAPAWFADGPPADVCGANRSSFTIMHGKSTQYRGTAAVLRGLALAAPRAPRLRAIMFEWFDHVAVTAHNELVAQIKTMGLVNIVDLRKPVQMDEMPAILSACDLGMIAHGRLLEAGTQPNRLYEYMASGLPILAPSYDKGIAPVIEAEQCGLLADFEDPASIADAIVHLNDNPVLCREMGRRARAAFLARHNWEIEVRPLVEKIRSWYPDKGSA